MTADRLASIRARADAAIESVLEAAMMGDTDGGIIDPESDIPIGEAFRLALPMVEAARTDIEFLLDQLAASEAKIAQAQIEADRLHAWIGVHPTLVLREKGLVVSERLQEALSASPMSALDAVRADVWDECLTAIEEHELNTDQARQGNPYRAAQTGATE